MASRRTQWIIAWAVTLAAALGATGCAYTYYANALVPLEEIAQGEGRTVTDDGAVIYTKARFELTVRPMTDEELNRQFAAQTTRGTNPYTFGESVVFRTNQVPQRFTVLRVAVKNYEYPKVLLDPSKVYITTSNGRKYFALQYLQLNNYFRGFALGGSGGESSGSGAVAGDRNGNEYKEWKDRTDLLKRTMYRSELVFSGQEQDGYLIFRPLAADVTDITVHVEDVAIRFDFRGEPVETIDVTAKFAREVGKQYTDGRREPMAAR